MSNSSLVTDVVMSPNHSGQRVASVSRITPHCVVGQFTAARIGEFFTSPARQASSNYGIGTDGSVGLYVDEWNRAWTSASYENDNQAITIECASDMTSPYAFNQTVWDKLVELCVDLCKRYGKKRLAWYGTLNETLRNQKDDEFVLTAHRWFAQTACPGDWMYSRMGKLAAEVTASLSDDVDKWQRNDTGWWWRRKDGSWPANEWEYINGDWYWFNKKGYAETGWEKIDGKWYWFDGSCKMVTGWKKIGEEWFCFNEKGDMKTGWVQYRDDWYYLTEERGSMVSKKFKEIDGSMYAFDSSGKMLKDTKIDVLPNGVIRC